MQSMKPGQPGNNQGRGFVICEVCDGYIKDMEQLRNHMQWIHKVCSNSISIVLSKVKTCCLIISFVISMLFI